MYWQLHKTQCWTRETIGLTQSGSLRDGQAVWPGQELCFAHLNPICWSIAWGPLMHQATPPMQRTRTESSSKSWPGFPPLQAVAKFPGDTQELSGAISLCVHLQQEYQTLNKVPAIAQNSIPGEAPNLCCIISFGCYSCGISSFATHLVAAPIGLPFRPSIFVKIHLHSLLKFGFGLLHVTSFKNKGQKVFRTKNIILS